MKNLYSFFLLAAWMSLQGVPPPSQQVAITIDDLPFVALGQFSFEEKHQMFIRILSTLKKYNVKIIGFTVGRTLTEENKIFLDELKREGHIIGNHTFSHPDLNKTSKDDYILDIERGGTAIKPWLGKLKYFRYPMLHRGDTQEKHDNVLNYLKKNKYTIVPVTIDNDEWLFNQKYVEALQQKDHLKMQKIGEAYLAHMNTETERYVDLADEKFKRSVKHILLIHMNVINSVYLDDLLSWYQQEGWEFISIPEALKDPVYSMEDQYIGEWGWSWLRRIQPL